MTHKQAQAELDRGTPVELICATCPWDRLCVEPPSISKQEIEQQIEEARRQDIAQDPDGKSMPTGSLFTALFLGGKESTGRLCPVFALRLRGPDGRRLADSLRQSMRTWDEPS